MIIEILEDWARVLGQATARSLDQIFKSMGEIQLWFREALVDID